jgi:hypothetical protein
MSPEAAITGSAAWAAETHTEQPSKTVANSPSSHLNNNPRAITGSIHSS